MLAMESQERLVRVLETLHTQAHVKTEQPSIHLAELW